jgi:hypothetical protein
VYIIALILVLFVTGVDANMSAAWRTHLEENYSDLPQELHLLKNGHVLQLLCNCKKKNDRAAALACLKDCFEFFNWKLLGDRIRSLEDRVKKWKKSPTTLPSFVEHAALFFNLASSTPKCSLLHLPSAPLIQPEESRMDVEAPPPPLYPSTPRVVTRQCTIPLTPKSKKIRQR